MSFYLASAYRLTDSLTTPPPPQVPVEPIRLVARCFAESCDYTFGVFLAYKMSFN